jgi:hypothetical protein
MMKDLKKLQGIDVIEDSEGTKIRRSFIHTIQVVESDKVSLI